MTRRWIPAAVLILTACSGQQPTVPDGVPVTPSALPQAGFTFVVTVPGSTPAGDTIYLAGDFQGWNPGDPAYALSERPDGRWEIHLFLPPGQPMQFKFTRGTWDRVEKGPNGEEISNRVLVPLDDETYEFTVATWADLGTVVGNVEQFSYPPFLSGRNIWVYLPPGYDDSAEHYPVLYMHDGQNLFDVSTSFAGEWMVDETCEDLITSGDIPPLIVVGIENGGASRITEYTPWPNPGYGGGGGHAYLTAVVNVLKPEIDQRYRTLADRANTYMSGSSLGGLISAYAGSEFSGTFSRVAPVSPSYWWAGGQMIQHAAAQGWSGLSRFYQDMGTLEGGTLTDANNNGIDDYIEDLRAMNDVLVAQGYLEGANLMSLEAAGHVHSESYWAQRFPDLLRFLVGFQATTGIPLEP